MPDYEQHMAFLASTQSSLTLVCSSLGHPTADAMLDPAGYSLPGGAG